jgi:flagellar hook-length control protein FliK
VSSSTNGASDSSPAIGGVNGGRSKPTNSASLASAQDANSAADEAEAPAPQASTAAPAPAAGGSQTPSATSAKANAPNPNTIASQNPPPSDAQTQSQDANAIPGGATQTDATSAASDRGAARAAVETNASATAGATANTQAAAGTKTDSAAVQNFGFSALTAANVAAGSSGPASSAAATTGAVPVAGLAVAIAARAQTGSNQFDIRLDPPELGAIDVRLEVDRDGQVTTHMTAERADTLQLLQNQQPQLEQALNQAGLKTGDNGLQFSLRDQSMSGQNQSFGGQNNGSGSQSTAHLVIPDADLRPIAAAQIYARAGLGSGLDIRI